MTTARATSSGCRGPIAEARRSGARAAAGAVLALALALAPAAARPSGEEGAGVGRICDLIEETAGAHALDPAFLARLIWRESRFDRRALSPAGAQGIARARGLDDPWDPGQAIPASAAYLADLRRAFGNWGLAAAAYNGGPGRVERFLAGARLPLETVRYVRAVTFRPVEWFLAPGRELEARPLDPDRPFGAACRDLPVMQTRAVLDVNAFPWGVQVAGAQSAGAARRALDRLAGRFPSLLGEREGVVMRRRRGRIASPWVARIAAPDRREAVLVCARLKRRGVPCVVLRN
jgi:hypothetical protein